MPEGKNVDHEGYGCCNCWRQRAGCCSVGLFTCNRSGCQKLQRSHSAFVIRKARLEVGIRRKIDGREGDVPQKTGFGTLHHHAGRRQA